MKRKFFFGKYYKFVSNDGFSFAIIDYFAGEEKGLQLITKEKSYFINDLNSIKISDDSVSFKVNQEDLTIDGTIEMTQLHPLKYNAMGPFKLFSMECSHDVYSMYHCLKGNVSINGEAHSFNDGVGYIEGDKGKSFPTKYTWYNSIGKDYGLTVAIATIPFGLINFTGVLAFININGKEYRLCTYNFVKIIEHSKEKIILKKGQYRLEVKLNKNEGKPLKAPTEGKMSRIIKENVSVESSFKFFKKNDLIIERKDINSSLEQMFD